MVGIRLHTHRWRAMQTYRAVRSSVRGLRRNLLLRKSRSKVRRAVGRADFARAAQLRITVLPNRLEWADHKFRSRYAIEKIFTVLKIKPQQFSPWDQYDLYLNWQDLTRNELDAEEYLTVAYQYSRNPGWEDNAISLNLGCRDISKNKIGQLNLQVFGYELDVDPTTHTGDLVIKSNNNATHDGVVVRGPVSPASVSEDKVYGVAIDNTDGDWVVDFRVPYIRGFCGFFYEKRRPRISRFSNINSKVRMRDIAEEVSSEELNRLEAFCHALRADYGELDVIRDKKTGKIYVVDFANTPAGPPNGLKRNLAFVAVERMSVSFIQNVLKPNRL